MFGILMVGLWLAIMLRLSIRFETHPGSRPAITQTVRSPALLALTCGLAPLWLVCGLRCLVTVPAAHVAAIYDPMRGGVQARVLPEGFHVLLPWWSVQVFSQQTQEYTMSSTRTEGAVLGDDSIRCQTNEGLNVQIDCTVLFHVDPHGANDVWRKLGDDYVRLIVRPYAQNILRMVVARYSVEDVYAGRRKLVETEVSDAMRPRFAEKGLVLEQLLIRNVQYGNPAFADAISAKQVAQQQVQTERARLQRASIEKQTIIAEATGEAQAIMKRGATLRENPEVVQYELVQKVAPRLKSLYLPASSLPVLRGGK